MMNPKIVSIFSGVGGIDTGFKNAGFSTIFANDNWKNACESFKKIFHKQRLCVPALRMLILRQYAVNMGE